MGVVMDVTENEESESMWRVVYRDDTMHLLTRENLLVAMELAKHASESIAQGCDDGEPETLIVHGKRKRNAVNYQELNDMLFAGRADSDVEGEGNEDELYTAADAEDDDHDSDAGSKPVKSELSGSKRSRRQRKTVDYRAMHEGTAP